MTKKILFEDAFILKIAQTARFLVHVLPLSVSLFLARRIGDIIYLTGKRRKIAYRNLRAAFSAERTVPQIRRIARRSVQNLVMSGVELLRFPDMDEQRIRECVRIIGTEKFEPYLKQGKGIIFLTAHFGNWEYLSAAGGVLGYQMAVLARPQKHPRSDEFLNTLRECKGSQVIRKGMPIREMLRALRNGRIVGLLSDQDGGKKGTFVRFFGRMSSTPSGAATFAIKTQAPIFPVFIFRDPTTRVHHRVEVEGPLRFPDTSMPAADAERYILQQFSDLLEDKIRKSPDQWLWPHRRWKSTPDRFVVVLSDGKKGHLKQSLAVLEAIKRERGKELGADFVRSKIIELRFRGDAADKMLRALCFITRGHIPFKKGLLKSMLTENCFNELLSSYADVVISCGSSLVAANLFLKKLNLAKSIVVMDPGVPPSHFDAVLAPRHDGLPRRRNIFVTEGAVSGLTAGDLETQGAALAKELSLSSTGKKIGVLVGGDTRGIRYSKELFEKIIDGIRRVSSATRVCVLATSSRRTPLWADEVLKKAFAGQPQCPLLVIANESDRNGVVGGILGLSDVLVVSGESISMVWEAVSSGKPVVVIEPWKNGKIKAKYNAFLSRLQDEKRIWKAPADAVDRVIQTQLERNGAGQFAFVSKEAEILNQAVREVLA